jgi:hypothetical protein
MAFAVREKRVKRHACKDSSQEAFRGMVWRKMWQATGVVFGGDVEKKRA